MYSKVKIFGHPLHPMLVSFPIAFYTSALVAFLAYGIKGNLFLFRLGYTANAAGVVMALVAAVPGFIDWYFGIPGDSRPKRDGLIHMSFNVTALVLFGANLYINGGQWNVVEPVLGGSIVLPVLGLLCTLGAGYFGWTLVQRHHVGVELSPEEEKCIRESMRYDSAARHAA